MLVRRAVERAHALLLALRRLLVGALLQRRALGGELLQAVEATRVELTSLDRCPHRAPGLALMGAVAEATFARERLDLGEEALEPLLADPQPDLAQARRVEKQRAA